LARWLLNHSAISLSAIDIQRQHFAVRRTDVQRIANLQRGVLIFRAGAVALRDIAGMGDPGNLQLVDVLFVNLVEGGETVAVGGVTPVRPVFLLFARGDRFNRHRFVALTSGWI
jgi:hypothetical protein